MSETPEERVDRLRALRLKAATHLGQHDRDHAHVFRDEKNLMQCVKRGIDRLADGERSELLAAYSAAFHGVTASA